jgi:cell fate regulator YaaT (PSP1 superfamily)
MTSQHLIRVGLVGHVGRFQSGDAAIYPRGASVIVRTTRGLEIGEVLAALENDAMSVGENDGIILRGMTVEDQLLNARLESKKQQAAIACEQLLAKHNSSAILIDVEHLFDGRTIFFYFLGDVPNEVQELTAELADTYDVAAQFQQFSATLEHGCGPGCGTEAAEGHGCKTCVSSCAISSVCSTSKHHHN